VESFTKAKPEVVPPAEASVVPVTPVPSVN
jgi:hypothetical protein